MSGEHIDLTSAAEAQDRASESLRRFLGIHFACCSVYTRVYVNAKQTAYEGRCPRCMRPVAIKIGPGGSDQRFFTAS